MSLARVKVWNPGDVLTANDLNGEFNNIINNPISLISPSTGAINFALQLHTNLVPSAITASSASAGQALIASGGATVWGTPTIASSSISIVAGSTGQVLAVTSSNSAPQFQVLPIDGGLSSTPPTAGMTYAISSSAGVLKGITIGTSGQVYTVSTSGMPVWATPSASGGTFDPESNVVFYEEFYTSDGAQTNPFRGQAGSWIVDAGGVVGLSSAESRYGVVDIQGNQGSISFASTGPYPIGPFLTSDKPTFKCRWRSTGTTVQRIGLADERADADETDGIWFRTSGGAGNVYAYVANSNVASTLNLGVTSSQYHKYSFTVVTSSSVSFSVDGVVIGTIASSNVPTVPLNVTAGSTNNSASMKVDYIHITSTRA